MTDVMDAVPAEDPVSQGAEQESDAEQPQRVDVFTAFGIYYQGFVDTLIAGTPRTGGNAYNKIDAQQLRLKAADFAYDMVRRGVTA